MTRGAHRQGLSQAAAACAVWALALAPAWRLASAETSPDEYAVEAAFLLNFARLVQWPADSFESDAAPLTVAALGSEAFVSELRELLDGERPGDRPVVVLPVEDPAELDAFHIVFVGASARRDLGDVLSSTRATHALVVGEGEDFARRGGSVGFFTEAGKVRFEINTDRARAAGLRVSPRLLRVARIVRDAG